MGKKLHIGGVTQHPDWEIFNIQPGPFVEHIGDAKDLSRFPDATFEAVYASHVLEHFDYYNGSIDAALKEWARVLSPDGTLYVSVPNLEVLCRLMVLPDLTIAERLWLMRTIFGGHMDQYDYHYVGLYPQLLAFYLHGAGFMHLQPVKSFGIFDDTSNTCFKGVQISLNVIARRRPPPDAVQAPAPNQPPAS